MSSFRRPTVLVTFALALVLSAGCSGSGQLTYNSAEDAYQKGLAAFEEEDYDEAVSFFRAVFKYGRDNEWADDAQFKLAEAYRNDGRYMLAATEYRRFARLYRSDERAPEAEYERAMAYYRLSPRYNLDQSDTERALSLLLLFADRYPQHEQAEDANEKIRELRGKLARKQLAAGRQYERRELWEAAAHAYESVFDQYPDTRWVDDALLGAVRTNVAYAQRSIPSRQADRYSQAIDNYRRLEQIFPDSPLLEEASSYYETARQRLQALEDDDTDTLAGTDG